MADASSNPPYAPAAKYLPVTEAAVIDALPQYENSFVRWFAIHCSKYTDAPLAYAAGSAYCLLAATAPMSLKLTGLGGGDVSPNLWTLLVGRSGRDRKSTVVNLARSMLKGTGLENELLAAKPTSAEALEKMMLSKPRQLHVFSEMGTILAETKMASNYYARVKPLLVDLYDGQSSGRENAAGQVIEAATTIHLSMLAAVNPSYLELLTDSSDWEAGFLSRFFTLYAESERSARKDTTDPAVREALRTWLVSVAHHEALPCGGMTPEAEEILFAWESEFEKRAEREAPHMSGHVARAITQVRKLALLTAWDVGEPRGMHSALGQSRWLLQPHHVVPAIKLGELSWRSVLYLAPLSASSKDIRDRRTVVNALQADQWTEMGELLRRCPKVGLQKRMNEVLSTLLATGEVMQHPNHFPPAYRLPTQAEEGVRGQGVVFGTDAEQTSAKPALRLVPNESPQGQTEAQDQTWSHSEAR